MGEVSEWLKEKVLKTFVVAISPRVRISPSPQRRNFKEISTLLERKNVQFFKNLRSVRFAFNMYYAYILQSLRDKSLYIGYTANLKKRFNERNNGKSLATKPLRPYELIFYEAFLNRVDAKRREEYLKSGWGFRSIKKMLSKYFN